MRAKCFVRYDISAILCEVGYASVSIIECYSGDTYECREKDYSLSRHEIGKWAEDLDKIVGAILEEKLWDAIP